MRNQHSPSRKVTIVLLAPQFSFLIRAYSDEAPLSHPPWEHGSDAAMHSCFRKDEIGHDETGHSFLPMIENLGCSLEQVDWIPGQKPDDDGGIQLA